MQENKIPPQQERLMKPYRQQLYEVTGAKGGSTSYEVVRCGVVFHRTAASPSFDCKYTKNPLHPVTNASCK